MSFFASGSANGVICMIAVYEKALDLSAIGYVAHGHVVVFGGRASIDEG
jgi:hypothetical protein